MRHDQNISRRWRVGKRLNQNQAKTTNPARHEARGLFQHRLAPDEGISAFLENLEHAISVFPSDVDWLMEWQG